MTSKTTGWEDILDDHFDKRARDFIHTSFPAVITRIVNSGVVDVQPTISTKRPDGTVIPSSELYDVRIQTYGVDGDVYISLPIRVGMKVWVFVSERDTAEYMQNERVLATTTITHDLSDCFCIPCFFTDRNIPEFSSEDLVIANQSTKIKIKADRIDIEALDTNTNGNILADGNIVATASVEASKFISEGQSGISTEIVVGSMKYTFTNGLLTKEEPV